MNVCTQLPIMLILIENCQKKIMISFKITKYPYNTIEIFNKIKDLLNEYDIGDTIYFVTLDNIVVNKSVYDSFKNGSILLLHDSWDLFSHALDVSYHQFMCSRWYEIDCTKLEQFKPCYHIYFLIFFKGTILMSDLSY